VAPRRWILLSLTAMLTIALAGCNSGSTANVQNPPAPPAAGLSIAFQPTPPSSTVLNVSMPITAVVTNDTSNGGSGSGVDWTLTCQTGPGTCGTLSLPHTNSGQATTYVPPASLTGNAEVVNIQGFATADNTKNVLASITITGFANNFSGTYVLAAQGVGGGSTYQYAGVVTLDGNGNITAGEQTVNFNDSGANVSYSGAIIPAGSSYFLGPDGRGTLTINPSNPTKDPNVVPQTFSVVFLSSSHALITANPTSALTISASGTMDIQASIIAPLSAGYAFVVNGMDFSLGGATALGGVFNVDSLANNPNNISGAGSVADQNQSITFSTGLVTQQKPFGIVTVPDQFGAVSLTLNFANFTTPIITFTGYIVDSTHIQLIESDSGGFLAGIAMGQGSSTGTFLNSSFSGPYVFGLKGVDVTSGLPDTFTSAGVFSSDGAGDLTDGYMDAVFATLISPITSLPAQLSGAFKGGIVVLETGRAHAGIYGFAAPNSAFQPFFIFYLTGNGNPPLVLATGDVSFNFPLIATGVAYPQSSTVAFSGTYGLNFTQQQNGTEYDGTAIMSVTPPLLSGVADVGPSTDQAFTGTFSTQSCSNVAIGCFSGSFSNATGTSAFVGTNATNPTAPVAFTADFYLIDQDHGFFVENDLAQQSQQSTAQVSLGFFATETAVQAPSATRATGRRSKQPAR
jgi:hypothetical protein